MVLIPARVTIDKPNTRSILDKGNTAVDMHCHTRFSDTYTRISKILNKCKDMGIGIAITDHNVIEGAIRAYKQSRDVLVIPGVEVSTAEGPHILAYFYKLKYLEEFYYCHIEPNLNQNPFSVTNLRIHKMLEACSRMECVTSAAHPFCPGGVGIYRELKRGSFGKEDIEKINAVEAITGINTRKMTIKSIYLAHNFNKAITGGSDAHSLYEVGRVLSYSKAGSLKKFLDNIKEHKNYVIGKESKIVTRIPSYSKMIKKQCNHIGPTIKLKYKATIGGAVRFHKPIIKHKIGSAVHKKDKRKT